jgi:methylthioribose-1-phosphate isomerase
MPILGWLIVNWRLVVVGLGAAALMVVAGYILWLQESRNDWKHKAETVLAINRANAVELENLRKSNEINLKIIQEQTARKAKQEKDLNAMVKDILSDDSSKDCPVSDSTRNLLNKLRPDSANQN